ncbi:MAG: hypothetical protein ACI956_001556 [Nonlabens sp.]|jgi:hypothetical protein
MKQFITFLFLFSITFLSAQMVDFEEFILDPETALDGSDGSGGFTSGEIFLPNFYVNEYGGYWASGWAISNATNVTSPNQDTASVSAIAGGGDTSSNYAVATAGFGAPIMNFTDPGFENTITSLSVTNSTLAYQVMVNGGSFGQKVFGGLTGNDPDFFLLTIKGYKDGILLPNGVDFYLADFRFTDNSEDYIVDQWVEVDLTSLEAPDSLAFSLSSSDNNANGMLTPGYFCVDNISVDKITANKNIAKNNDFTIAPNPANGFFQISNVGSAADCSIYDLSGKLVFHNVVEEQANIDISNLSNGTYLVKVISEHSLGTELLSVFK